MKGSERVLFAVLTGDIVKSTRMSAELLEQTRRLISDVVSNFAKTMSEDVLAAGPQFFRGDSWQLLLHEPRSALRLALLIRATLVWRLGTDTRISIGIGAVDAIVPEQPSLSSGGAFILSGRALDKITGRYLLTGAIGWDGGPAQHWLPVLLHLCSESSRSWTKLQAEVVAMGLAHKTISQITLGELLGRTQQTIQERQSGAHWWPLKEAVELFESLDWDATVPANTPVVT